MFFCLQISFAFDQNLLQNYRNQIWNKKVVKQIIFKKKTSSGFSKWDYQYKLSTELCI